MLLTSGAVDPDCGCGSIETIEIDNCMKPVDGPVEHDSA